MEKTEILSRQVSDKKTQVIGARIPYPDYNKLEIRCFEKRIPMSAIIQKAVNDYLNNYN